MELMKQGAEARLYETKFQGKTVIVKERFAKNYRHPELDKRLTKERLRAELKGLIRCKTVGIRTPAVYFVDDIKSSIYLEKIENVDTVNVFVGNLIKARSGKLSITQDVDFPELVILAKEIGQTIGTMHTAGIIHGDLTTSNILIDSRKEVPELILIDFGLSHFDNSAEDKGVDLYVLERALKSTYSNIPWFFELMLDSYKISNVKDGNEVLRKLDEIRLRGRKRTMVG